MADKTGKTDRVLAEVIEAKSAVRLLVVKLYGENGFEGDITEIKRKLTLIDEIQARSKINRYIIIGMLTVLAGGGGVGATKILQIISQITQ